jgi:crotonobetainyl-CoA:carnitine CoA-transferase CaiB-like acyl-CoA transferase
VLDGERLGVRDNPPALGQDTEALLVSLGFSEQAIRDLQDQQIVKVYPQSAASDPTR